MARTRAVGKAGIYSAFSASGGRLIFERESASVGIEYGSDGSGIDMSWWGETAGAKMRWIASSDTLAVTSADVTFTGNDFNFASASMSGKLAVGGTVYLGGNGTQLQVLEVASRGAITASAPDHYISIGLIASGSVITAYVPCFASA